MHLSKGVFLQGGVPQYPDIGLDLRRAGHHWHQLAHRTYMLACERKTTMMIRGVARLPFLDGFRKLLQCGMGLSTFKSHTVGIPEPHNRCSRSRISRLAIDGQAHHVDRAIINSRRAQDLRVPDPG